MYYCEYHIILVTKYRREIFNEGIFGWLEKRMLEVKKHYPQIEYKETNHDKDHIHMLVSIPPTMGVGQFVRLIKSNMAKDLKQKFPILKEVYWGTESIWSSGYFVSTVGVNEKIIREYIKKQGEEDSGQAKLVLA